MMTAEEARAWFSPRSILVAGASRERATLGTIFLRRQREFGYDGTVHVLHPEAQEIEGFPCIKTLSELDGPVDYAYIAVPGADTVRLLTNAAGRLRVAQIISSGFREAGREGEDLERQMTEVARNGDIRLVGPNCMGSYSPGGRLTMIDGAPRESGPIAVVSQSGVAACDVIKMGAFMGGRFSQVVSIGNCADIDPVDVYEHFVTDPAVGVIGMYVEGLTRGRALIDAVRRAEGSKPTVVLKGGATDQGVRSVASHTGALVSDHRIWRGLARQFGLMLKTSIEDFVGTLVAASQWDVAAPFTGRRCCLAGPGGVLSVLGTDLLRRSGLDVPALGEATLHRLEALRLPPGSSMRNPIDTPVGVMQAQGGRAFGHILKIIAEADEIDWFIVHISIQNLFSFLGDPQTALDNSLAGFLEVAEAFRGRARWCLVLRTNGDPALDPIRARCITAASARGVPVFTRLEDAAAAVASVAGWLEHRDRARAHAAGR